MAWLGCCPFALLASREAHDVTTGYLWFEKSSYFSRIKRATIGHVRAIEAYHYGKATAEHERYSKKS